MAFTRVQQTGASNSATKAFGSTITAGNLAAVWVVFQTTGIPGAGTTVTDSAGNTYSVQGSVQVGSGTTHYSLKLFTAPITTGGASVTVTLTPPSGASGESIAISEYSFTGVLSIEASSPVSATGSTGTSISSGSQTLTGSSDLVLGAAVASGTGQTWSAGGSMTQLFSSAGSSGVGAVQTVDQTGVGAGSFNVTMTDSVSSPWACMAVAFKGSLTNMAATEAHDAFAATGGFSDLGSISVTAGSDTAAMVGPNNPHGTISITAASDAGSFSGHFVSPASMAKTEVHDTFAAPAKFLDAASMAKTEAHDAFSATGHFATSASTAVTEAHDAFAGVGIGPTASIAVAEHGDTFAATALVAGNATMAKTEAHDTLSCFAQVSPFLRAKEGGDLFSGAGASTTSTSSMAVTSGSDVFHATGGFSFDTVATMHRVEHGDVAAFVGTQSSAATMGAHEHGDSFVGTSAIHVNATMGATEGSDSFHGGFQSVSYHVYWNGGSGPINYSSAVDTTTTLTYTTPALAFPATHQFGVRAFYTIGGLEEQNVDAVVTLVLDASGRDITNTPPSPLGLRAFPIAGGMVRIEWTSPPTTPAKAPITFNVYKGVGSIDYGTIVTSIAFNTGLASSFVANIGPLVDGTTYLIGVRAMNATGEEKNTNSVSVTADNTGPAAVVGLTAVATI